MVWSVVIGAIPTIVIHSLSFTVTRASLRRMVGHCTMNREMEALLLEMLEIITHYLLQKGEFCGSTSGRRLNELRWQLLGVSRSRLVPERGDGDLVNRTVWLTAETDQALTEYAASLGQPQSVVIED